MGMLSHIGGSGRVIDSEFVAARQRAAWFQSVRRDSGVLPSPRAGRTHLIVAWRAHQGPEAA